MLNSKAIENEQKLLYLTGDTLTWVRGVLQVAKPLITEFLSPL